MPRKRSFCRSNSLRAVKSKTKVMASGKEPTWRKRVPPVRTGTRLPSFATYSFSNGIKVPVANSSSPAWTSRAWYSGGVIVVHCIRPAIRSSRVYPKSSSKASLASRMFPSRSTSAIPMILESTNRRNRASLSRKASSACFSSVISMQAPNRWVGLPWAS